ncbi:MAG: hypothetical protein ACP5IM_01780 [Candidatus Bathyarchaeia archaeon]
MPSPTISHLICTVALISLIFVMQFYYFYAVNNLQVQMIEKELKEVADYTANTIENLYIIANSSSSDIHLKKELSLPKFIQDSAYVVEIVKNGTLASSVHAYMKLSPSIEAYSWLISGLKVETQNSIESGKSNVFLECERRGGDIYVWFSST